MNTNALDITIPNLDLDKESGKESKKELNEAIKPKGSSFDSIIEIEDSEKVSPIKPKLDDVNKTSEELKQVSVSTALIEMSASIKSSVDTLGLDEVRQHTITYVDNDNRSVLLVNKYLMVTGRDPLPIIAPALMSYHLSVIEDDDLPKQGDIVLFELDGFAQVGILMSSDASEQELKILTTLGEEVAVLVIPSCDIIEFMR